MPSKDVRIEVIKPVRQTKAEAKKFVKLVEGGKLPDEAAAALGIEMREISSPEMLGEKLKRLLEVWRLAPELKKEVWQAAMFKIFVENALSKDETTKKIAVEVGKVLRDDPEMGIGAAPKERTADVKVEVNLGALGEKLQGLTVDTVVVEEGGDGEKS